MTDPGIGAAVTTALVLIAILVVGSLVARARACRERDRFRRASRAEWQAEWLVGDEAISLALAEAVRP